MVYFVDTGYFLGLVLEQDGLHQSAVEWQMTAEGEFVTTDYVLVETINGLSDRRVRAIADKLLGHLRAAPEFTVVPASRALMDAGMDLFRDRPDKDWSLTDCISFVVMRERRIADALSADHHFTQAGFRALLDEA